ncbi:MAG: YraN family protein [Clostridia bacterium]|nr:YraN family protein [Clostridia bacterium]
MGEIESTRFFRDNGYKILNVNFRTRFGEIDIICTKGNYIIFAEVKTRCEDSIAKPREFVDYNKQSKIVNTAMIYLSSNKFKLQPRFDVVEVVHSKSGVKINHIKNAFGG